MIQLKKMNKNNWIFNLGFSKNYSFFSIWRCKENTMIRIFKKEFVTKTIF